MAINFKLGPVAQADPATDDMGRDWIGWTHLHTAQKTYEQNRGVWVLGQRAERERLATFSYDGEIKLVVEIEKIETVPAKMSDARSKSAIVGRVLEPGDPRHDALIGQRVDAHRNPVTYIAEPTAGNPACACGCGAPVPAHRSFLPGHDQRAVHERIARQWGSTLGFIDWFDATYPATR
ncbi:MAG: hypothetical protein ACYCTH_03265 [Cellulomonas sp.]